MTTSDAETAAAVNIIGTCGHKFDGEWWESGKFAITYYDKYGDPCEVSACVCRECHPWYEKTFQITHDIIEDENYE